LLLGHHLKANRAKKASGFNVFPAATALTKGSALRGLEKQDGAVPFGFTVIISYRGEWLCWAEDSFGLQPNTFHE
jgi:hypothetical protein